MKSSEEMEWKVLHREYLAREPWFTARKDDVRLPNGSRIPEYYVLEYPDWVNVLAVTASGEFVFVRQYRHGLGAVGFELCAGVCEPEDVSPLESARRELLEETGFGNGVWREYMQISANPGTHTNLTHCFLATGVERISDQHLEPTEELDVYLLTLDEVKDLLRNDEIKQAIHAAPLWKYMAEHRLW